MDNDSTTIARVKAQVNPNISKRSDSNHTKKGFTGALVELSSAHKVLRNVKVRGHMERCFMYCIQQNKDNPSQLETDLRNIVPHLYGEHQSCGQWCKSQKTGYKPKHLPCGKPLSCTVLRTALEDLFEKYAKKASELSHIGSTQLNENFNLMVSSKAPKRLYFGGSESLHSRVSATVCQKNDGYSYVTELNKKLALSPGLFTTKHTVRLANKLKRKRLQQSQQSMKRRRLELKAERLSKDASQSVLEGDTYRSKIGMNDDAADLEDITIVSLKPSPESSSLMYFDLETTGFQRTSDIVQIAAVCGEKSLNIYLKPNGRISEGSSKVTGLTYENGILKRLGQPLVSVSADEGLKQFIMFLASSSKPFLIGHNIQNFDVPILIHNLQKYNLVNSFQNEVSGFIDTYKLSKKVFEKSSVANFKQETLVKTFIGIDYDAHNAMSDVTSLRLLYEKKLAIHCGDTDVFSLAYYSDKSSLEPLVHKKVISSVICLRLVSCALSLNKLKLIHTRDPHNGIRNVFSESVSDSKRVRISKSKNVIDKVVDFLNSL